MNKVTKKVRVQIIREYHYEFPVTIETMMEDKELINEELQEQAFMQIYDLDADYIKTHYSKCELLED